MYVLVLRSLLNDVSCPSVPNVLRWRTLSVRSFQAFLGGESCPCLCWYQFIDHCLTYCLFSFCHCIVSPSSIYSFWLPIWYLQASLCPFAFFFCHFKKVVPYFCVLCEGYYVIIWRIVRICVFIKDWRHIYSELFIASLCPFALFILSLYCLSFFYLRLLITSLVSSSFSLSCCPFHFVIVLSVLLFTASDYLFGKRKRQKDKEKLEGTKEVIRSRK
jgi:hypothetical protein